MLYLRRSWTRDAKFSISCRLLRRPTDWFIEYKGYCRRPYSGSILSLPSRPSGTLKLSALHRAGQAVPTCFHPTRGVNNFTWLFTSNLPEVGSNVLHASSGGGHEIVFCSSRNPRTAYQYKYNFQLLPSRQPGPSLAHALHLELQTKNWLLP